MKKSTKILIICIVALLVGAALSYCAKTITRNFQFQTFLVRENITLNIRDWTWDKEASSVSILSTVSSALVKAGWEKELFLNKDEDYNLILSVDLKDKLSQDLPSWLLSSRDGIKVLLMRYKLSLESDEVFSSILFALEADGWGWKDGKGEGEHCQFVLILSK